MSNIQTIRVNHCWWASWQREVVFTDGGRIWPRVDCYGFVRLALAAERGVIMREWPGLKLDDLKVSGRDFLEDGFTAGFSPVETGFEQAFDGALIRRLMAVDGAMKRGWWHCGIVTRPGFIVHLEPGQGIVETCFRDCPESLGDPSMRAKDVRLYRHGTIAAAGVLQKESEAA